MLENSWIGPRLVMSQPWGFRSSHKNEKAANGKKTDQICIQRNQRHCSLPLAEFMSPRSSSRMNIWLQYQRSHNWRCSGFITVEDSQINECFLMCHSLCAAATGGRFFNST